MQQPEISIHPLIGRLRAKNPKYESMSLEELKANMEKSRQELEAAIHHKNILEQRKKLVERRERSTG